MSRIEELLTGMFEAARENHQVAFDELEAELLDAYPGGFRGMPRDVYERYLEVDRQWPIALGPPPGQPSVDPELGPRALLSARIPELQIAWLIEEGARAGCARAEVLSACLQLVASDSELVRALRQRLRERSRSR